MLKVFYFWEENFISYCLRRCIKIKRDFLYSCRGIYSGEMKHGPIALVDDKVPVIVIAPKDFLFEKNISNMEEILARGGKVILITDKNGSKEIENKTLKKIVINNLHEFVLTNYFPYQIACILQQFKKGLMLTNQEIWLNQ